MIRVCENEITTIMCYGILLYKYRDHDFSHYSYQEELPVCLNISYNDSDIVQGKDIRTYFFTYMLKRN